jgi:hypothetical protein
MENKEFVERSVKVADLIDEGWLLQRDHKLAEAKAKYNEAFLLAKENADWFIETGEEPTRTALCLHVAHLALDAERLSDVQDYANKVIEFGVDADSIEEAKILLKQ